MRLYKDSSDRWRVNEGIIPAGACYIRKNKGENVEIYFLNQKLLYQGAVSGIERIGALQVTEVTLTGTEGNMTIGVGDTEEPVSFDTSLADTAAAFVTDSAAAFLPGIIVTSDDDKIIFTAAARGTQFEVAVTPGTGDIDGEISDASLPAAYGNYETFIEECGDFFCNPTQLS